MTRLILEIDVDNNGQATNASLTVSDCLEGISFEDRQVEFEMLTIQVGKNIPSSFTAILKEDNEGTAAETKLLLSNVGFNVAIAPDDTIENLLC